MQTISIELPVRDATAVATELRAAADIHHGMAKLTHATPTERQFHAERAQLLQEVGDDLLQRIEAHSHITNPHLEAF